MEYPIWIEVKTANHWLSTGAIKIDGIGQENTYYVDIFNQEFFCKNYPKIEEGQLWDIYKLLEDIKQDLKQATITKEAYKTTMLNTPIDEYKTTYVGYIQETLQDIIEILNELEDTK